MRVIRSQDLYESHLSTIDEAAVRVPKKARGTKPPREYMAGRSDAGKRISGDENTGPRYYTLGHSNTDPDSPTLPNQRPVGTPRVTRSELNYARTRYNSRRNINAEFELWVNELLDEGYDLSDCTYDEIYDLYERCNFHNLILDYLIDEGYAEDYGSANDMSNYMSEEWIFDIIESQKWIQKAIKKPGALSKQLGVPEEKNIPRKLLTKASKRKGKLGKRARLALTLRKFH
jgi:hypothetical protein